MNDLSLTLDEAISVARQVMDATTLAMTTRPELPARGAMTIAIKWPTRWWQTIPPSCRKKKCNGRCQS